MKPIVKLENLSVVYDFGKSNEVWALKDISLEIFPREYIIFFGPSGCGKSTLLYTIAGLEIPTKGRVIVNGKDLSSLSEEEIINFHRSTIGMVFQAYYLLPALSVKKNILLPQLFTEASFSERKERVLFLMEKFGLSELAERKPSQLSGGQQQRVAIARALINDPPIVLADEPTGNLDSKNAEIVLDLLERLNERDGKTIIHVTHNPQDLYRANRVFHMKDGKIVRVTRNPEKMSPIGFFGEEISELEKLAQSYPWFPESRLQAKLIVSHLLCSYGEDVQSKMEVVVDKYIQNKITEEEMFKIFDLPEEKGGLGLYTQSAQELAERIIKIVGRVKMLRGETEQKVSFRELVGEIRDLLLEGYSGHLSFEQIERLDKFLAQRIAKKVTREKFRKLLDKPFKEGGVGLNKRTAKKFSDETEIILMK